VSAAMTAIGLMSGLSLDGIEVALVVTDGERQLERGESLTFPYGPELRERLREAIAAAWRVNGEGGGTASDRDLLAAVEQELTGLHAEAVKFFLEIHALARDAVAVLGFHGHTVCRDAARGILRQIGDGEVLARATGIDVVFDFRAADMAAGGHGAPMLSVYHRALAEQAGLARPLAVITIGAVNSITFIGEDGNLVAVDVGPTPNAEGIASSIETLPAKPRMWLLAGRGAGNAALVDALRGMVAEPVYLAAELGWSADHLEAEAFAYLAVRSLRRLPLSFPGTTGVKQPTTGGRLARAPRR
jgi:1,6-anhydro-N-acetylmuramate kinase